MGKMKDSGVEWIGEIPEDWKVVKVKYILQNKRNAIKVGPFGSQLSGSDILSEGKYWIYNQRTVLSNEFDFCSAYISEQKFKELAGFQVSAGDILLTTRGSIGKISRVPNEYKEGVIHPCIIRFNIDEKKYLYTFLRFIFNDSDLVLNQIKYNSNSTTIDAIYSDTLKNIVIPLVNIEIQNKIICELNYKVSQIDFILEKTKATIEDYKSYKKSLVIEAVRKGLKKDRELKESGVVWIGKMPSDWEICKLKHAIFPRKRDVILDDEIVTCFRDGIVTLRKNRREEGFTVSITENGYQGVEKGDLVIHGMDAFAGAIGCSDSRGKITPVVHVCETSGNNRYFMYFLRHMAYSNIFMDFANGVRIRSSDYRNFEKLGIFDVLIPSVEEQKEIAEYLDVKCAEIDKMIASKVALISELEAYKKSVIYEYVTGKREVV